MGRRGLEYTAHADNLSLLVETLRLAVPLKMAEIHADASRWQALDPEHPGLYERRVRELGARVDPAYVRTTFDEHTGIGRKNRITGGEIADTNAMIIASQGDTLFGSSKAGAGETVAVALITTVAAAALINPDGVTFGGAHFCRGRCEGCRRSSDGETCWTVC